MFPSHLLYVWFVQCFVCYMCLLQYLGLSFCLTCPCFITVFVTIFLFIIVAMDSTYFIMKTFFIIFVMYTFYYVVFFCHITIIGFCRNINYFTASLIFWNKPCSCVPFA